MHQPLLEEPVKEGNNVMWLFYVTIHSVVDKKLILFYVLEAEAMEARGFEDLIWSLVCNCKTKYAKYIHDINPIPDTIRFTKIIHVAILRTRTY